MSIQPLPYLSVDAVAVPPKERVDFWRECIQDAFDVRRREGTVAEDVHASLQGYHLGDVLLGRAQDRGLDYTSSTSPQRSDHILIQSYLQGGLSGDMDGRDVSVSAGQTSVIDLARPMRGDRLGCADLVNLVIPRDALSLGMQDLHGAVLEDERGEFLADYLVSLLGALPSMQQSDAAGIARITRDMVAVCLRPTAENRERAMRQIEAGYLRRAKRLIEEQLRAPDLTAGRLCCQLGISRSSLYRLFEPLGGVARYIQGRRLEQIREALRTPRETRSLRDLAQVYGFSDGAHLSRAFRARFGMSPSDVRQAQPQDLHSAEGANAASNQAASQLSVWLRNLAR